MLLEISGLNLTNFNYQILQIIAPSFQIFLNERANGM
jgi:hypothetical protein